MSRPLLSATTLVAALALAASPGWARSHKKPEAEKKPAAEPAPAKPVQVGKFGDWGVYVAKGKSKTCYALASPTDAKSEAKHGAAYVFIADRPAEKVHNEVSIMLGFPIRESGATAKVGSASYPLVAKGANAWIKDPADEPKFVETMEHGGKLVIRAAPVKGPAATQTYSLSGLKPALARVTKDCR